MTAPNFFKSPQGRRIAYHLSAGEGPTIVFLGGLKSDMEGTKAIHLETWARARGRPFLRFDYSGHGESSGTFEEGCIGDWAEDSQAIIENLTNGPVVLVGSSMGGWQALLLARHLQSRIRGMVTIAAAPDFTEEGYWNSFSDTQKAVLEKEGQIEIPSEYMEPYIITRRMIEDGRDNLVLRSPLELGFPVRFLQGTADTAVSTKTAVSLLDHVTGSDVRLLLVKGADHRFSDDLCLRLMEEAVVDVLT